MRLLQINVGRGAQAQELALVSALEEKIDVLLIQEPYIFHDTSRQIPRRHTAYDCYIPTDDWAFKPRVLTFVRKGAGLKPEQLRPLHNIAARDLLFISLTSPTQRRILITNVYNAPFGSNNEQAALCALRSLPIDFFPSLSLVAGDFNLHHHRWEPDYGAGTGQAETLVEWMDTLE